MLLSIEVIPYQGEDKALRQLEEFLEPHLKEACTNKTVQKIFEETHQEMR